MLSITWNIAELTVEQLAWFNDLALAYGYTGTPLTVDDDGTHDVFAFITNALKDKAVQDVANYRNTQSYAINLNSSEAVGNVITIG